MFTGIVTAVGRVASVHASDGGIDLAIEAPYADLELGESIAVDGACLTVIRVDASGFVAHVVRTSLERTRFGELAAGDPVNLERALRAGDRLGGHLVQGHVDGVGRVEGMREHVDARLLDIRVPPVVAEVTIPLGSVTVDGVSLTVNALPERDLVQVALIPFTLQHTTLGSRRPGHRVHLEGDTIGKYVKALTGR
jgi:riboflavin synthase